MHDPVEMIPVQIQRLLEPGSDGHFGIGVMDPDGMQSQKHRDQRIGGGGQRKYPVGGDEHDHKTGRENAGQQPELRIRGRLRHPDRDDHIPGQQPG